MIKHVSTIDELKELLNQNKKVLVDFFATWCGPCMQLSPIIEKFENDNADKICVIKIDVDKANSLAFEYGISVIPTLVLFENGKEIKRNTGALDAGNLAKFAGL